MKVIGKLFFHEICRNFFTDPIHQLTIFITQQKTP
jgi:hypothetical protein